MVGIVGKKVGMTRVYDEAGIIVPVTVISADPNVVTQTQEGPMEKEGYSAIQVGFEAQGKKPSQQTRPRPLQEAFRRGSQKDTEGVSS